MSKVVVMDHPLIQHKIGVIRRKETGSRDFRAMIGEIASLITYEATKDLKLQDVSKAVAIVVGPPVRRRQRSWPERRWPSCRFCARAWVW